MKAGMAAGIGLMMLSGCANLSEDSSAVLRSAAVAQVEAFEAAGLDVVSLTVEQKALALSSCAMATALLTVWNPAVESASPRVTAWCAELVEAAG